MAKTKYSYNEKRGAWIASVWDGTYDEKGRKHRRWVTSKKSSRDLERQIDEIKQRVKEHGALEFSDQSFYDYALAWLSTAKASRERNTRFMYENAIRVHLSFLDNIRISDIRHSHFQQAINRQIDHPRTCEMCLLMFIKSIIILHLMGLLD